MYNFRDVTLLITHYNRSSSLERLLKTFKELNCVFDDIVVSDDGSKPEHIKALQALTNTYKFRLITTPKNKGLGNNINKGQEAVTTPYTLYVQEDFVPTALFPDKFVKAVDIMNRESKWDIIRFYAYGPYSYMKPYDEDFSEMYIKPWFTKTAKIYVYSDHPHLRRSNFLTKFGKYAEGIKGDRTEYRMCITFIQKHGQGLFYNKYKELFLQKNSEDEPTTMTRSSLSRTKNPFISVIRQVYRQARYNFDIHFMR
ncbi:MAG: glycosyl transferase family 2 [Cytophagales bacterium CG18_big_fil_WC_8_21_14_2_50_42_9]|nr:MAG: glycosyl transferase family 2 [Cytophagales bacterium CG18_big_fil_WC_8_21_14_2_50_42_9]